MAGKSIGVDHAEALAAHALGFVAADPDLLPRFLAVTGIQPSDIRRAAREPGFLAGVLAFVLAHEPTAARFASEYGATPAALADALRLLPGGDGRCDASV